MKALVYFLLNVCCLFPVLLSLDPFTPTVFLALASAFLLVQRPERWWALLAALAGALVLAWWVFLSNWLWTVGGNAVERSVYLAVRAWGLTGISVAFALGIRTSDLLNEAMQLAGLPARVGYALFTALNTLPRLREEQKHLGAVHRVRLGGRSSPFLIQAITLLARAIRSGERSAQSLAARGLENPFPRTWFRPVAWTRADALALGLGVVGAGGLFAGLVTSRLFVFGFY